MIARHWSGVFRQEDAAAYTSHLEQVLFPELKALNGFVSATIQQRATATGIEFLVISVWSSMEAIRQFAGDTPDEAVVPSHVQAMAVSYDRSVRHYHITHTA